MTASTPAPWPALADLDGTCKPLPGFSSYVASDRGYVCSVDRTLGGRRLKGVVLRPRVAANGYALVNLTDDQGRKQTRTVHGLVLLAHAGAPKPGEETLHGRGGPLDNRYPENIRYGTRSQNELDKVAAGTASTGPALSYPCLNAPRCGGLAGKPGRRCRDCVVQAGVDAAEMLRKRVPLQAVADHFGYTGTEWVFRLAVEHGGYAGSQLEARNQRPRWTRRVITAVMATVRHPRRAGGGDGK